MTLATNMVYPFSRSKQRACVCRATINSSFVGTIQICARLSVALIAAFAFGRGVQRRIEHDAQFFQVRAHTPARMLTPFSPMPPVNTIASAPPSSTSMPPRCRRISADEHIERQSGPRVALGRRFFQIANVAADAAQAQQPALLGQRVEHFVQRLARRLHDHGNRERIEIADAVVVRQARLRAHAHRWWPRSCRRESRTGSSSRRGGRR